MSTQRSDRTNKWYRSVNSSRYSSIAEVSSSKKHQVYDTVNVGLDVVANVTEGSDILAPLKAACKTAKSVLEIMRTIESNQEEWTDLTRRLEEYIIALEEQIALIEKYPPEDRAIHEAIKRPLTHYIELLKGMQQTVDNLQEKRSRRKFGLFKSMSKVRTDAEEIRRFNRDIEDRHRQLISALTLFIALRIQAMEETSKASMEKIKAEADAAAILQLPIVDFAASSVHSPCMEGTRETVLEMIRHWALDERSDKPIFWLCDIAGSGKSTVAISALEAWQREGALGGRFFFSIASSEGSTTDKFCSTIARNLAHYIPQLTQHIADAIKRNPSFMQNSLGEQFQMLVTGPLLHWQQRVILVIDAVDECKSGSQRKQLLETLCTAARECKILKIFMTSRPDPVIQSTLGSLSIKAKLEDRLHDVSHSDNVDDIATYINRSLDGVLPPDRRQRLVEKARGLFIWASTACRMLNSEATWDTPENTYDCLISVDKAGDIDDVYSLIFERIDPKAQEPMCKVVALLLAAFDPLTANELQDILTHVKVRGSVKALVQNLGSVLSMDPNTKLIQFRHPTFVEYLRRCSMAPAINRVSIKLSDAHGQAASWCLNRLTSRAEGLKFNICQIESSFCLNRQIPNLDDRISKCIPRMLQYASSHWAFHVAETNDSWRGILKKELKCIVQTSYALYWMEILSFTIGVPRAIEGLQAITRHARLEEETRNRMTEIRRFMMAFSIPIQDSVPHIYISALPFAPKESIMHVEGRMKYTRTLTVTRGLEKMYSGLPRVLRVPRGGVIAASFSPDGSRIVSGSSDGTIQLWEAETGQQLGEPLRGHEDSVTAVGFSPDGSQIVSGSKDGTIRLWVANTGQPLGEPLRGHKDSVAAVDFSPDGSQIISGSEDGMVQLWEVDTGHPLGEQLQGHEASVTAVRFSPDGSRIVSGSSDRTIRLWEADTGQPFGEPLQGHNGTVWTVRFSPDGSRIISGSEDRTIRLWEANSGRPLGRPLRGHEDSVTAVGFSPDGSLIVSGSKDRTIRLWEAATGQPLGEPLGGHEVWVMAVEFSPDGSRILSGSADGTIRLWESDTGKPLGEPLQGHEASVTAVGFSPDGSQIVSSSSDKTIRLWVAETGQPLGEPLRGHEGITWAVGFSPDGSKVVSGSSDGTIRLWETITGQPLGEPLRGHEGSVRTVRFSPDGSRVVSGSSDKTIRLWETSTGQPLGEPLRGHKASVTAVRFSPDGSRIVSCSSDKTIRLWEASTGQPLGEPLRGHVGWVTAVGFSPDGSIIVSGSVDRTIRLWEADTGQTLGEPLRGHEGWVTAVEFSSDGSRIVSGSSDKTIRLWEAGTGQPLGEPLRGHVGWVTAVGFSPDNSLIVSGSEDTTVRLWEADTNQPLGKALRGREGSAKSLGFSPDVLQIVSGSEVSTIPLWDTENKGSKDIPLKITVPGFNQCSLSQDGWVRSSNKVLFWVPPDNRNGLVYPHILTIPTTSRFRPTRIDFTNFQCGPSWTNVQTDID